MSALAVLISSNAPTESTSVQQKAYVTYAYPTHPNDESEYSDRTVTILESKWVLGSSGSTGHRTWEASLCLAAFLTSEKGQRLVKGKRVFELGAGSGMLSILCAKHLGVARIVATDGEEVIIDTLKTNIFLNGLDSDGPYNTLIRTAALKWGRHLDAESFEEDYGMEIPEVLLGADVVSYFFLETLIIGHTCSAR